MHGQCGSHGVINAQWITLKHDTQRFFKRYKYYLPINIKYWRTISKKVHKGVVSVVNPDKKYISLPPLPTIIKYRFRNISISSFWEKNSRPALFLILFGAHGMNDRDWILSGQLFPKKILFHSLPLNWLVQFEILLGRGKSRLHCIWGFKSIS